MEPRYPIRTAAKLTALSLDTLRAWERRYSAVTPNRTDRGRLYSKSDIAKLILLRKLVEHGFAIGRIAALDTPALEELLAAPHPPEASPPHAPDPRIARLADLFTAFDDLRAGAELSRLALLTPPRDLVMDTLLPLMREVGERWSQGRMSIAQEHRLRRHAQPARLSCGPTLRPPERPRMILATLAGDFHDFGILAAAMIAAATGWSPLFLGSSLPGIEIAAAARDTKSAVIVIGNSGHRLLAASVRDLASHLLPDVALWLGGTFPDQADTGLPPSVVLISDMRDFEAVCLRAIR